jgi:signal transduction histidine kinase
MKTGIYFLIQSLLFSILLIIIYFNKKRLETTENKIYSCLIMTSVIEIILELVLDIIMPVYTSNILLSTFIAKTYCVVILIWLSLLITYVTIITIVQKNKTENKKIIKSIFILITIISALLIYVSPINFYYDKIVYYTYGPSVNVDYIMSFIYITIGIICLIWNRENIKNKKYIPIFIFLIIGGITGYIQFKYPSLLLSTGVHTFITFLMYFTIENPDMQMVEELNENKKLTEQNYEEKTKFIFKISQDLKKPLHDITNISNEIIENPKDIEEKIKIINTNSKQLYTYVNNALDVSKMDISNLKIVENTYNTKNFFEELKLRIKREIKESNKEIEFRYEISNNIPENLQGDNTKLKQIIMSVIYDSIKYTEKGFIELNINTIIKYGICRLMIEISDSGKGMSIHKINTILNVSEKIETKEQERIEKLDISLPLAHKIIKTMNGSFIIKSEENKGSNFLIIIDQKIEEKKENTKLENYSKKILNEKKVLIVSVDNDTVNRVTETLEEYEIVNSLYGKDAKERLKKEKYEFIIIEDELKNESGIEVLNQIKELTNKPIFIIINKNKEFMGEHYKEDGFKNYIIKEKLEEDLKSNIKSI